MTLEEKAGMCSGKDFWRLKDKITFSTTVQRPMVIHANTTIAELMDNPRTHDAILNIASKLGSSMTGSSNDSPQSRSASEATTPEMTLKIIENSPLRALKNFMGISENELQKIIRKLTEKQLTNTTNHISTTT